MWLDSFIDLIVFEPIYDLALPAQHRQPLDVGETLPMQVSQGLFHVREIDDLPAQARELVEQRPFSGALSTILHLVTKNLSFCLSSMCSFGDGGTVT